MKLDSLRMFHRDAISRAQPNRQTYAFVVSGDSLGRCVSNLIAWFLSVSLVEGNKVKRMDVPAGRQCFPASWA